MQMNEPPPTCSLDARGVQSQGERYRRAGSGAHVLERAADTLVVRLSDEVDNRLVDELVAVERRCCPFFSIVWDSASRRLSVRVARREDEPGIEAIADALGVVAPVATVTPPIAQAPISCADTHNHVYRRWPRQ